MPRPSYPLFEHLTSLDGLVARAYDLEYNGVWSIDFTSLEHAHSLRARAVLLVNPNNPTGSFVSQHELDRLSTFCAGLDMALIVDEVFADYELEPRDGGTLVRESWDISQEKGPVKGILRTGKSKEHTRSSMEKTLVNIAKLVEQ